MVKMKIDYKLVTVKNGEFETNDNELKTELVKLRDEFTPEIMPNEGSVDVALAKQIVVYLQDRARKAEIVEVKLPKPRMSGMVY